MARQQKTSDIAEAEVVDLAHDGRGVARVEGKAVFIEGALPGERVRLRVYKRRRQFDEAGLVEILSASPERVSPRCMHFGVCGGCSLQHLSADAQLEAKQKQLLENLRRIGRVEPTRLLPPLRGPQWAYRRRARLGVKFVHKKGRVLAGFREREKPYLADIRHCEILQFPLRDLPLSLAALVETLKMREDIPQVEVAAAEHATALVFRLMSSPDSEDLDKIARFGAERGVQIFLQPGALDSVRPLREDYPPLTYAVDSGRVVIEFGPVDFIQVNGAINASMVEAALQCLQLAPGHTLIDLFCGLGNFTLPAARRVRRAVGVEGDGLLVAKAAGNARRNQILNAEFFKADLFEPASFGPWALERFDRVLLDPPRAGAAQLLPCMRQWRPERVVYISCHPGSLARDAGILVEEMGFELAAAGVMDMFPHTTHVESIAVFERRP